MKPANIIIAAATLILLSGLLSGCGTGETPVTADADKTAPVQQIENARKLMKDVSLKLSSEKKDNTVTVSVALDNPNQKPITSTESWFTYNPKNLKGVKVDFTGSPFTLPAPYENTFDAINGLVMIGRSNNTPVSDATINVATITFELNGGTAMIDAYDYQNDLSGHVSANMMLDGVPYNVLVPPTSPALIIQ